MERLGNVETLVLLRHGATAWNESGYCQGRRDVPLAPAGRRQAEALRDTLAGMRFDRVCSSLLQRAVETASIASGVEPTTIAELAEIDRGHWEGHDAAEIRRRWGKLHQQWYDDPAGLAMPGGEEFDALWERAGRVLAILEGWQAPTLLACGHKAINRVLLARLLGRPSKGVWQIPQPQACLSILRLKGDRWVIDRLGDVNHLPEALRSDL